MGRECSLQERVLDKERAPFTASKTCPLGADRSTTEEVTCCDACLPFRACPGLPSSSAHRDSQGRGTAGPFAEVLDVAKTNAAREGLTIRVGRVQRLRRPECGTRGRGPGCRTSFQHRPFLQAQLDARGYDPVPVGKTVLVPIAFYSKRYKSVNEIPAGATIAIPNDPSNEARTLLLLETTGLIKLRPTPASRRPPRHGREPKEHQVHRIRGSATGSRTR